MGRQARGKKDRRGKLERVLPFDHHSPDLLPWQRVAVRVVRSYPFNPDHAYKISVMHAHDCTQDGDGSPCSCDGASHPRIVIRDLDVTPEDN